jgi:hypothetical protein
MMPNEEREKQLAKIGYELFLKAQSVIINELKASVIMNGVDKSDNWKHEMFLIGLVAINFLVKSESMRLCKIIEDNYDRFLNKFIGELDEFLHDESHSFKEHVVN